MVDSKMNSPYRMFARRMLISLLKDEYEEVYFDIPRILPYVTNQSVREVFTELQTHPVVYYKGSIKWLNQPAKS